MKKELHVVVTVSNKNFIRFSGLILFFILSINLSGQKVYTMLGETFTAGNWQNFSLQTNTYDGITGYMTTSMNQLWDAPSTTWENGSLTNYTYNPDGTKNVVTTQIWDGVSAYNDLSRTTYTYNLAKKELTILSELKLGLVFQSSSLITNTYDVSGYLTNSLIQTYLLGNPQNSSQINYVNNPNGTINQATTQTYVGGVWADSQRSTYAYNAGKVQTVTTDKWTSGILGPYSKDLYSYDGGGHLINLKFQLWDAGSSSYKDDSQSNYEYNLDGTLFRGTFQSWNGSVWVNISRFTYNYNIPTGISELIKEEDFTIYPNPAYDLVTIKANKSTTGSAYSFTDQSGKLVLKGILMDETTSIDITQLAKGVYFLNIGGRSPQALKVIKQ